ncbi:MAG TPA: hypothetical protein PK636_02795 [bacterium]|nr:hypothetical protein [bacterium]HPJ71593.1 hypothetical protein [bacterium]HPQ65984.1 hypothetical protein [bacterium]
MGFFYCFACSKFFESDDSTCLRCGRGAAEARRELVKSGPQADIYRIIVGDRAVGNHRVNKKA